MSHDAPRLFTVCRRFRHGWSTRLIPHAAALVCLMQNAMWAAPPGSPAPQYVEGEVLVTFNSGASLATAQRILQAHALEFTTHFAILSAQRNQHSGLVRAQQRTTAALIAELSQDPDVAVVEPNYLRWVSSATPNDALFPQLWSLRNTGQPVNGVAGTFGDDIKFLSAWSLARPSTNQVVIAVIDTGVDYHHPDLAPNMWTNSGEIPNNGVDEDGNGFVDDQYGFDFADGIADPADSGYHGTHVAGTIAGAGNNQLGVIGVDYQAKIMALKASNNGTNFSSATIIQAIQYATMMKTRGVNVVAINASFGGGGFSSLESAAIQSAGNAGIIYCSAANNNSVNIDVTPDYPSSYRLANMIVVAATDQNDALASFSNYGANSVDLGAPGVSILSTTPTNMPGTIAYVLQGSTTYTANPLTYSGTTTGITATVYDCGLGFPTNFPVAVRNNIALIGRGTLFFMDKVSNAIAAGARAAILYNNTNGNFLGTLQVTSNWIPAIAISQADGLVLKALLPTPGTVVNRLDPTQIYQLLNGTSMATPHVAGAVAFAAMNFPDETVAQRIQRILANVDIVPGLQGRVRTGGRLNLLRTVDADANGLPDWWEQMYFGQPAGTNPSGDADRDGASNLAEWQAGTNPTNAGSFLHLTAPPFEPANSFVIQWPSVAGKFYQLERATNLQAGFDSFVRTNIAATPPTNTESDSTFLPGNSRYYRLHLEP